jgi:hypothetical protein
MDANMWLTTTLALIEKGSALAWAWLGLQAVGLVVVAIWGWHIFMPRKR